MLTEIGKKAKSAETVLSCAGTNIKNDALSAIAEKLIEKTDSYRQQKRRPQSENGRYFRVAG